MWQWTRARGRNLMRSQGNDTMPMPSSSAVSIEPACLAKWGCSSSNCVTLASTYVSREEWLLLSSLYHYAWNHNLCCNPQRGRMAVTIKAEVLYLMLIGFDYNFQIRELLKFWTLCIPRCHFVWSWEGLSTNLSVSLPGWQDRMCCMRFAVYKTHDIYFPFCSVSP